MRILFLFLLLMNLLFFGWQSWYPQQTVVAADPLPAGLSSIKLMREAEAGSHSQKDEIVQVEESQPDSKTCHTLGPFEDEQIVEELKQKLQANTTQLTVRVIQESQLHRYWVYQKVSNNEEALAVSRSLVQQNISDYYIMTSGVDKKVSLGHFKEKAYAERREQQLRQLGFPVETEVVYHYFKLYWLDYALLATQRDQVKDLITPYLINEISILNRECEKISY
jgi:hypothetical protein